MGGNPYRQTTHHRLDLPLTHGPRDPRDTFSPSLRDRAVNVVGLRSWASFGVPLAQLDKAVLTLGPQQAALLLPGGSQTSVRPVGTKRGAVWSRPAQIGARHISLSLPTFFEFDPEA